MKDKKCKFCEKIITGFTDEQIEHLMNQHLISVHKDKIEIREKKQ